MPINTHDIEWLSLGLTPDALRATMHVQERHLSPFGRLYGGAAVAAAVTIMEEATGRAAVWATVQFASTCGAGDVLDLRTTVVAAGRRTAQLRVVASLGGAEVFAALGSVRTAPGSSEAVPGAQWAAMPEVPAPDACARIDLDGIPHQGYLRDADLRVATPLEADGPPRCALWCRAAGGGRLSTGVLGWHADALGFAIARPVGAAGSTSLDNTVRFGPPADPLDEWVLLDIHGQMVDAGVGHGTVDLWSPGGVLLATASQTCLLRSALPGPRPGG